MKQSIQEQLNMFTNDYQSVVIATLTEKQKPYTSYAPYVYVGRHYYFLISKIAKHYSNLVGNPNASIMFIEDESKTPNIFFRKRLSYAISTNLDIKDKAIQEAFVNRFGDMANMLFKMDFVIVKCFIENGRLVVGPGQAYDIDSNMNVIEHLTSAKGHSRN